MHAGDADNGRDRVSKKRKKEMTATSENVSVKVLERTEARATRATGVASTATGSSLYVARNET